MKIKKYAAIDIGSNGVRLLVSNVMVKKDGTYPLFRKSALVRVPIRLGADTFVKGIISRNNIKRLTDTMKAFKLLMDVHGVESYRACATSAMREAENSKNVVEKISSESNIQIDIIDGKTEASIIAATDLYEVIQKQNNYLYIDVGGGSTEFSIYSKGKLIQSKSFKIGTVRSLGIKKDFKIMRKEAKMWIKEGLKNYTNCTVIGSGGNINKIFKLSATKIGKPLTLCYLKQQYRKIKSLSYEQRIRVIGLNQDRADVIIPALKIYIDAMKWSNADEIIVPKIGLADGIIKTLYAKENQ